MPFIDNTCENLRDAFARAHEGATLRLAGPVGIFALGLAGVLGCENGALQTISGLGMALGISMTDRTLNP